MKGQRDDKKLLLKGGGATPLTPPLDQARELNVVVLSFRMVLEDNKGGLPGLLDGAFQGKKVFIPLFFSTQLMVTLH